MVNSATGLLGNPVDDIRIGQGPFGTGFRTVPPPEIFDIGFTADKTTLIFTLGDSVVTAQRRLKSVYRVYFAPVSLAGPAVISQPFQAYNVFQQSQMIGSTSAPQNGVTVQIRDTVHAGLDGWFFATAVNLFGIESSFVGPKRNPIVGTNDSRVPPDIGNQTLVFEDGGLDPAGRRIVKCVATYVVPSQTQGVSNIQVTAFGTGYTGVPDVTFTGGGGSGAMAEAILQNDQVVGVKVIAAGTGYTTAPAVGFSGGGGSGAAATAFLTVTGSFGGVQMYIQNYFQEGIIVEGVEIANPQIDQTTGASAPQPGQVIRGEFLLLADSPPTHDVKFYFVALSQTGTRAFDPTATAPFVDKANGVGVGL